MFQQPAGRLQFSVDGETGTAGFYNITVPSDLISGTFSIYKDSTLLIENLDYTQTYNSTHYTFSSIKYEHSTHTIEIFATTIIPELTSIVMLSTLVITTVAVAIYGKYSKKKKN